MGISVERTVVTGMGIASSLGCGMQHIWQSLLVGKSGITRLSEWLVTDIPCKVVGQVPLIGSDPLYDFDSLATTPAKERKKTDRFTKLAPVAAREALVQVGWPPVPEAEQEHTATVIAIGIDGFSEIVSAVHTTDERGPRRLSPFIIPSFLTDLAAGHVSVVHGLRGSIGAPVTACAAGIQVVGDAVRMIHSGETNIALYGGAEAAIHHVSLAGFAAARVLSSASNDQSETASRSSDHDRSSFVMGGGAGPTVIEPLEHVLARGTMPLTRPVGYGTSADAHHLIADLEDGDGACRAMETTTRQAGVTVNKIDYINAHATPTQIGDKGELTAIKVLFGAHSVVAASTKSVTSHLLGTAGGIRTIFTIQVLYDQVVPSTLNLHHPDGEAAGLNLVALQACPREIRYALSNGFDFGGINASLLLKRWE